MRTQTILRLMVVSIVLSAITLLSGCENQSVDSVNAITPEISVVSDPQIRKEIKWLFDNHVINQSQYDDWNRNGIVFEQWPDKEMNTGFQDVYPTHGDVAFSRNLIASTIKSETESKNMRHRVGQYTYVGGTFKVRLHNNLPTLWRTAYSQAAAAWNALGESVSMTVYQATDNTTKSGELDVDYYYTGNTNEAGRTLIPQNSGMNSLTRINSGCNVSISAYSKKMIAMHEIGHALGFGHTDSSDCSLLSIWYAPGCSSFTDNNSIMKDGYYNIYGYSSLVNPVFSDCDKAAIGYLWG